MNALKIAVLSAILLLGAVHLWFRWRSPDVTVAYSQTVGNTSLFRVANRGSARRFIRMNRFLVSTAKFGNLEPDEFESKLSDLGRFVSAGTEMAIAVDAAGDTEEYLCSSLRSIGFFAKYGSLKQGRLLADERPASLRNQQILGDLNCRFRFFDFEAKPESFDNRTLRVPCDRVSWVAACVSEILPTAD
jgi:hypothetical protein